mmetsp:Transcript_87894/g.253796  ORF Transcript_87894/g.253796 Transcript_87894/m.253796 type:complete len:282 (+) Transcript_87894:1714-2559(+)
MVQPSSRTLAVRESPFSCGRDGRTRTATVIAFTRSSASRDRGSSSRSTAQPQPDFAHTTPDSGLSSHKPRFAQDTRSNSGTPNKENTSSNEAGAHFSSHSLAAARALMMKCRNNWSPNAATSADETCEEFTCGMNLPRNLPAASRSYQRSRAACTDESFIKEVAMSSRMGACASSRSRSAATATRDAKVSSLRCWMTLWCSSASSTEMLRDSAIASNMASFSPISASRMKPATECKPSLQSVFKDCRLNCFFSPVVLENTEKHLHLLQDFMCAATFASTSA